MGEGSGSQVVHCFEVIHNSWKIPTSHTKDEWWK